MKVAMMGPYAPAAVILLILAGCGSTPPRGPEQSRRATQVFVGNCITVEGLKESAIGESILSSVISQGLTRIGTTLEASAAEQTWTTSGATNFEAKTGAYPRCVQIVQGRFFATPTPGTLEAWAKGTEYEDYAGQLGRRGILLAAQPEFFFEGVFRPAQDGTAMAIVPAALGFHQPIGTRPLRSDAARRTKVTFVLHPAGKAASDGTNAVTELDFGMLWPSKVMTFDTGCLASGIAPAVPTGSASSTPSSQPGSGPPSARPPGSQPVPATPPVPAAGRPSTACSVESLWMRAAATATYAPMSLTATVSQTQDRSDVLGFVADVFKSSKTEIERWAKEELIASEREKARLGALEAQTTQMTKYTTAAAAALQALEKCVSEPTTANRSTARLKQMETNLTAEQAGQPRPFADADMPALGGKEPEATDNAKAACGRAITSFR
jgi:hypothetical protein